MSVYKLLAEQAKPLLVESIEAYCIKSIGGKTLTDAALALAKAIVSKKIDVSDVADKALVSMQEYFPEPYNAIALARYELREELAATLDYAEADVMVADRAMAHLLELKSKDLLELEWHINRWWATAVALFSD
jgi:hypothetical protein